MSAVSVSVSVIAVTREIMSPDSAALEFWMSDVDTLNNLAKERGGVRENYRIDDIAACSCTSRLIVNILTSSVTSNDSVVMVADPSQAPWCTFFDDIGRSEDFRIGLDGFDLCEGENSAYEIIAHIVQR